MTIRAKTPDEVMAEHMDYFVQQGKDFYLIGIAGLRMRRESSLQEVTDFKVNFYHLMQTAETDAVRLIGGFSDGIPGWVFTNDEQLACMMKLKFAKWLRVVRTYNELKPYLDRTYTVSDLEMVVSMPELSQEIEYTLEQLQKHDDMCFVESMKDGADAIEARYPSADDKDEYADLPNRKYFTPMPRFP